MQTFKIILNTLLKNIADNPPVQIYTNKIKSRIVFETKTSYKLALLSPETIKLLGSTKKVVDRDKDREDLSKLESVDVVLVHYNLYNLGRYYKKWDI